jgi:hypothetical protein
MSHGASIRGPSTTLSRGDIADGLLDPLAIAALAVLLLNDHVLKRAAVGTSWSVVTGKLSDAAGMVFFPVLCVAAIEIGLRVVGRARAPSVGVAVVVAVVVGAVFAAINVSVVCGTVYATVLGTMQWPFLAAASLVQSKAVPAVLPVAHVVDPTDAPFAFAAAYVVFQSRRRRQRALSVVS